MSDRIEHKKLTPNERTFVIEITRTDANRPRTAGDAYRTAYAANGNRRTITVDASKIMAKTHVAAAIENIRMDLEADRRRKSLGQQQAIQTALWNEVNAADGRPADRISALGKLITLLPKDPEEYSPLKDSAASKAELISRVEAILSEHIKDAIDITAESDVVEPDESTEEDEVLEIEAEIVDPSF